MVLCKVDIVKVFLPIKGKMPELLMLTFSSCFYVAIIKKVCHLYEHSKNTYESYRKIAIYS